MQYYKNDFCADEFEQLQKNELVQFELLKKLLNNKFGSMVDQLGLSFSYELVRWTEDSYHKGHNYDGYTATLEAKLLKNGFVLCAPNNDAEYTFFVNICNIRYYPLKKSYSIYFIHEYESFINEIQFNMDDIKTFLGKSNQ